MAEVPIGYDIDDPWSAVEKIENIVIDRDVIEYIADEWFRK